MDQTIYNILKTFEENNFEAYILGGYVRESILFDMETFDVDITTNATPKDVVSLFPDYDIKLFEYGNVFFEVNGFKFDITTYRKDINYLNNRRPEKIVYVDSLREDIKRRDFTFNTICIDKEKNIVDYYNGLKDLRHKLIKSVGDPDVKFKEDPLRILRAIRFAATYKFRLDHDVKIAIMNNKDLLKNLSFDRKKDELSKIFCSKYKKYGVNLIKKLGLEEALDLKDVSKAILTNDLIAIWSVVTDIDYSFTKREKDLIKKIHNMMNEDINDVFVQYQFGLYPISVVSDLKKLNTKKITSKYDSLPIKDRNELKINTDDICEILDREPGNFIKDVFETLEKEVLLRRLDNNYDDIKNFILKNFK